MRLSKFIERAPEVKVKQRNGKSVATSVIGHASFVPIVTLWGAALFGLSVMVLSSVAIARISTLTGLGALGGYAQEIFALIAAALGALSGFILAAAVQNRVRKSAENGSLVSAMASRHKGPIDPAAELGSESLDAPIETVPFGADDWSADERDTQDSEFEELPAGLIADCSASSTQSDDDAPGFTRSDFRAALIETCEGATCEAATGEPDQSLADADAGEKADAAQSLSELQNKPAAPRDRPQELDLSEFAEMPGRDAVWVDDTPEVAPEAASELGSEVTAASSSAKPEPEDALEKLRSKLPEELSLVEMVERFAGALHDHQQAERERQPQSAPVRDAALAEALKALTLFTQRGFDNAATPVQSAVQTDETEEELGALGQTERDLREALVKLQSLRGAA